MGRRKIEIARIESARNRAVTFLKRKNGLFKKAYELGVLCSVDVAVIVFEERPGHDHKLYSYCSGDIREIIARHVHFDGESETRGVADFLNNASKANETADAEDDEEEEEEPAPPPKTAAKRSKKTNDDDAEYGATMSIPSPPISIRKFPKSTTIPTSSDRHSTRPGKSNGSSSQPPSKKQRTASPRDRASSDEDTGLNLPLPLPNAASYGFPPMMYRGGGGGYGLPSQPPFFPSLYDPPATYRSQAQYDPGMYHQLLRAQQRAALHSQSHPNPFALDWPVHGSGGGTHLQNTQGASSWNIDHFIHSIMYPDEAPPTQAPDVGGGSGNWLDLFAGLPPPPPPLPTGGGPATATSWERGGGGGGNDLDDDGGGRSSSSKRRKRAKSRSRSSSDDDEQTADDKDG